MPTEITTVLKDWGVTIGLLSVIATAFIFVFMFSLREFTYWFLRLHLIRKNQQKVLERLDALDLKIQDLIIQNRSESMGVTSKVQDNSLTHGVINHHGEINTSENKNIHFPLSQDSKKNQAVNPSLQ